MARQVVGIHSSKEALNVRPNEITEVILRKGYERNKDLVPFFEFAKKRRLPFKEKPDGFLEKICRHHQGVCLTLKSGPEFPWQKIQDDENSPMTLLALDEIADPHNLGAIMRTAWLMGVDGLIVTDKRSASLTPTAIKVASGGAEHIPVDFATNLHAELKALKDNGFWIYGLAGEATNGIHQLSLPERVIWVVGSEESGLRAPVRKICDELVSIPQLSPGASYNASVATAMALYETRRQKL